jgi:hypothetical protein
LRLAGLLWRLRRTTRIEAGLFDIQATHLSDLNTHQAAQRQIMHAIFGQSVVPSEQQIPAKAEVDETWSVFVPKSAASGNPSSDLARCYPRLAHLPNFALDRLNRYEAMPWRQAAQTPFALNVLDRRKPLERKSHFDRIDPD